MRTRGAVGVAAAVLALATVTGSSATHAAPAVPTAAIVSLDLRTHRQQTYPINDLQGLSPNGRRITFVTRRGNEEFQLRASALDGSANRVLLRSPFPGYLAWPRWSPNGREIAFLGPDGLSLIPAGGGTPRTLSTDADAAAWAPDSRRLAFPGELEPSGSARLVVQNEDGSGRRVLGERRPIYSLSWAADGKRVLYSTDAPWERERDTGRIHAVDAAKSADLVLARGVDPAWSHDGKLLSFVGTSRGA